MADIECTMCDSAPPNRASIIMTNIDTGDVQSVCGECFPTFILSLAEALAGTVDETAPEGPESFPDIPEEQYTEIDSEGDSVDPTPARRPPGRTQAGSSDRRTDTDGDAPAGTTDEPATAEAQ